MAGDRRTRRLTDDPPSSQRTLDPAPPSPVTTGNLDPPELLEPPPLQDSAAGLEERQRRWFQLRERAIERVEKSAKRKGASAENPPPDPKG
jgi:hypothetical protein